MSESVRVLHVDDEPGFADMAAQFLEREDDRFSVVTANGADEGLDYLEDGRFDCIVSDYDMPGRSGIEFLDAVREEYPDLPFVLFTGKGSEEIASDAISAGVTDYLQKEGSTDQYTVLANRIGNAVSQYRAEQTAQRVREIAENSDDILWMFSADWEELLFINSRYENIYGRSVDALREDPSDFMDGVHPDDREQVREVMDRLSNGESVDVEYRVNEAEDYSRWLWVRGTPIRNEEGDVERVTGFARDVTARNRRERILEELHTVATEITSYDTREAVCHRTVDAARTILDFDTCTISLECDGILEPVATSEGIPVEELSPMSVEEGLLGKTYRTGEPFIVDDVRSHPGAEPKGEYRSALSVPVGDVGVFQAATTEPGAVDETDRDLVELLLSHTARALERLSYTRELERERDRFAAIFEAMPDPVAHTEFEDGDPIVKNVNREFVETFDVRPSEIEGESIDEHIVPDDRRDEAESVDEKLQKEDAGEWEVERLAGTERRTFLFRGSHVDVDDGKRETIGVYTDVTERKERERELRQSEQRYRRLLEIAPSPVFIYTADGELVYANEAAVEFVGADDRSTLLETDAGDFTHPEDRRTIERRQRRLVEEREPVPPTEMRIVDANGEKRHAIVASTPVTYEGEQAIQTVATDITAQKRRERELQNQKARLEQVASVISHDLRNPLRVADGRLELAREECDSDHLEDVAHAVDRSLALIDDLLILAREREHISDVEPVDVAETVDDCWRTVATAEATLVCETDRTIAADPSKVKQLLENLVRNAVEHGTDDGTVTVRVGDLPDGFYLEDDGPGIPDAEREEVFEPGYSTSSEGTGLGLSIVEQVVEAHDWEISVIEGTDGGARFEITGVERPE